ncbi:magnesium chelatase domain-containing protein, partial [Cognatishimia sp. D5M38]
MSARSYTVAFEGVDAHLVEVQCAITPGMPAFSIVGLPDKAVSEARERIRAAMNALAIALPSKRITVNLSPADLPKEGSHFDLPIAIALLAVLDIIPKDAAEATLALGELSLDGTLIPVTGALPAAMTAARENRRLLCPAASGPEAAWVGATEVIAPRGLTEALRHFTGQNPIAPSQPGEVIKEDSLKDLRDVKSQYRAKRALEIAAAGRHHLLTLCLINTTNHNAISQTGKAISTFNVILLKNSEGRILLKNSPLIEAEVTDSISILNGGLSDDGTETRSAGGFVLR